MILREFKSSEFAAGVWAKFGGPKFQQRSEKAAETRKMAAAGRRLKTMLQAAKAQAKKHIAIWDLETVFA
jgi:hypothetical protein